MNKKIKKIFCFLSFTFILSICFISGKNAIGEEVRINKTILNVGNITGDTWKGENTILGVNHANWTASSNPVTISSVGGSDSFKFTFNRGGQYSGKNAILFEEQYDISDITKITFSVYLHLSPSKVCSDWDDNMGVYLYSTDAVGYKGTTIQTDGYRFSKDEIEDEWFDLTIAGDDLKIFSDKNDKFSGFQFGARHNGAPDSTAYATGNYIAVRSVNIEVGNFKIVTLNFNDDVTPNKNVKVLYGEKMIKPSFPLREGFEFVSWQNNNSDFDFNTPITTDITLNATWKTSSKLQIRFDSNGGTDVVPKYANAGETIERPADPTKENSVFGGWYFNDQLFDFNTPISSNMTLVARWRDRETNLTKLNGDYSLTECKLLGVNGTSAQSVNTAQYGCGQPSWERSTNLGDSDSNAFQIFFHSYGMTRTLSGIKFNIEVNPKDVMGVTFRFKCHFSSSNTYNTTLGGVIIYALDATGLTEGSGYMIPANIKQDEWVNVTITGDDMLKIADADGIIRGFQIGLNVHAADNSDFYTGSYGQRNSYLAFDGASVSRKIEITYEYGDQVKIEEGATGISKKHFYPSLENKVFVGWINKDTNEPVDSNTIFDWDTTLVALFVDETNIEDGVYYSEKATGKIGEGSYIIINDGKIDLSDTTDLNVEYAGYSNGILIAFFSNGERVDYVFNDQNYVKTDFCNVTVNSGRSDNDFVIKVAKGKRINQPQIERIGFELIGFKCDGVLFDFNTPIVEDIELKAVFEYDEIENENWYSIYQGIYYSQKKETYYILDSNKTYIVKSGNDEKYGNYIILVDGVIIFMSENGDVEGTITGSSIETDEIVLEKLTPVIVRFDSKGGSDVPTANLGLENDFKLVKPVDPTRDGYTFKGWFTSDGKEFEFDQVLLNSITLYAKWEKTNGSNNNTKKDNKGCKNSLTGVAFVALLPVIPLICFKREEDC